MEQLTKTCTRCGETKPVEGYYKTPKGKYGRVAKCKPCLKAYSDKWYAANPGYDANYRATHHAQIAAGWADWCARNREYVRGYEAARYAAETAPYLASSAKHRGATVIEKFTTDELRAHLRVRGIDPDICIYCGQAPREHWDHVMPIALGGVHTMDNLAPACAPCNIRKSATHPDEFKP